VHTGFWWANLRARDHLDGLGIDGSIIIIIIIIIIIKCVAWPGLIWPTIWTSGGLL
jgi:hypothetical protein